MEEEGGTAECKFLWDVPISDGHNPKPHSLSEERLTPLAGCSMLGCPQVLQWQEPVPGARRAHLNASADVVHDLDGPAVLVAREGLGESGDLHPPFGLGTRFLPVDGLTGGALQAAILQGGGKAGIRAPQPHHWDAGHAELLVLGQLSTLLPLEYMASTQSMWKECWQLVRRPTISGLIALHSHASP